MAFQVALLREVVGMALDTLRANKLRSFLTILGVIIGVMSIVAMTALIRGFGASLETAIRQLGSNTVIVSKFSIASFSSGKDFWDLIKRPDLTEADAQAIRDLAPSVGVVSTQIGGGPTAVFERITYGGESTKRTVVVGTAANWPQVNYVSMASGRSFAEYEVERRRRVVVLGASVGEALFKNVDPLGKRIRIGREEYTVIGVLAKRPSPLGSGDNDQLAVIPVTTYEKTYPPQRIRGYLLSFRMIMAAPAEGASREALMTEMEQILRARHRLKLDQENDFDILTSDSILAILDQLTRAVALALVVISSIALMVGGIGVMAIMTISVTERTREIGVRKALGARRREILWQFLVEAVVLTSVGGILGILIGSGIGLAVNRLAGFPVSLPLWSFALGLGFSASVGIFFGMFPAIKASRLDPIEALRYE